MLPLRLSLSKKKERKDMNHDAANTTEATMDPSEVPVTSSTATASILSETATPTNKRGMGKISAASPIHEQHQNPKRSRI